MGRDKAILLLGGKTLLARAVELLQAVKRLKPPDGDTVVTIAGERTELEGAARSIRDSYPGCGPLGGMEAALRDMEETDRGELALFAPVDMPFLTSELIDMLLVEWSEAAGQGALVCYVVADSTPQPLLSLVHRSLRPFLAQALKGGRFKVTAALQSALALLALTEGNTTGLQTTQLQHLTHSRSFAAYPAGQASRLLAPDYLVDGGQIDGGQRLRSLSFTNVNTPEDFSRAETFFTHQGSREYLW